MANEIQLKLLKQGVVAWNRWRKENPVVEPDLSESDLRGADLTGTDLTEANFFRANLPRANLTRANLTGANLNGAVLTEANFTRANLLRANLIEAVLNGTNLFRANLTRANLTGANLNGAVLWEANVEKAFLGDTLFADTNLSGTKGLDTCHHLGPSTLDHRTLAVNPHLPVEFLQGVGLPEERIHAYLHGNQLTIEFTSARYGQLIPIEFALRTSLGDDYIVEKDADRIVVKLDSPDQFQAALETVIPVLMALEAASPGESKRLGVEPKEGPSEHIENEALMTVLLYLVQRFDEEHPQAKLTASQEAIVETVKGGLRGVLGLALQKFFEARAERELPIYQRFKPALEDLKGVAELPAHEEEPPKQLPPASDKGT